MHNTSKEKFVKKSRIFTSNTIINVSSSNWSHDWWQFSKKSYASVLKSKKLVEYGIVDNNCVNMKANVDPNHCVRRVRPVHMFAMNTNHQGVKKSKTLPSRPQINIIECVQ